MTKFKMHLLGYFLVALFSCSLLTVKSLHAGWSDTGEEEVFYEEEYVEKDAYYEEPVEEPTEEVTYVEPNGNEAPAWPLQHTEAAMDAEEMEKTKFSDDIGEPMPKDGWSGGADLVPVEKEKEKRIYNEQDYDNSFMPLGTKDLTVDDGDRTLSASIPPGYGITSRKVKRDVEDVLPDLSGKELPIGEQIKDWIAKEGFTLREVLETWSNEEGWEIIWSTKREYPLQASAIFRGRFKDVSAALVRTFAKAAPPPYAKFYKGNRVIVVKTLEDDNAN
jgi:hypothetical protein